MKAIVIDLFAYAEGVSSRSLCHSDCYGHFFTTIFWYA